MPRLSVEAAAPDGKQTESLVDANANKITTNRPHLLHQRYARHWLEPCGSGQRRRRHRHTRRPSWTWWLVCPRGAVNLGTGTTSKLSVCLYIFRFYLTKGNQQVQQNTLDDAGNKALASKANTTSPGLEPATLGGNTILHLRYQQGTGLCSSLNYCRCTPTITITSCQHITGIAPYYVRIRFLAPTKITSIG